MLAIKPEYVSRIFDGSKKYEFRRYLAKRKVDKIYIYETAPIMKVVGEVDVVGTLSLQPKQLWKLTNKNAGIDKASFDKYFQNSPIGHAYQLGEVRMYDVPKPLNDFGFSYATQSFVYID